jgi:hypothetical protein
MKYKIEYRGHGVRFTPVYATTIKGAVMVARKKGWRTYDPSDPLNHCDMRPNQAWIFERSGESWERVGIVTEHGIEADDSQYRTSHKRAIAAKDAATRVIESNYATMAALNAISNNEYAKACEL